MRLDPVEVGRLAIMQAGPLRYVERRVEELELVDDFRYFVTTRLQFVAPHHRRKEEEESRKNVGLLVPLGWYSKERMPDIRVQDEHGTDLPLIRRRDQGRVIASFFGIRWRQHFLGSLNGSPDTSEADLIWEIVQTSIEHIVTAQRLGAQIVIYRLRRFLLERSKVDGLSQGLRCLLLDILMADDFWRSLKKLGENRLLIAHMRGRPGRTYVLKLTNTERFDYGPSLPLLVRQFFRSHSRRGVRQSLSEILSKIFGWLGIGRVSIVRYAANLGQAASFWVILETPDGVEPLRCFWRSQRGDAAREDVISVGNGKVAIGKHHEDGTTVAPDELALDVQMATSQSVASAAGLAALLYLVGLFVYKAMPQLVHEQLVHRAHSDYTTRLLGIGTILAAAPATIAGALAYRGHGFVRRISRGPRVILALLASEGGLLAAVASLRGPGGFAEVLSFLMSLTGLCAAGLFFWIRCGPRWRKTDRSRLSGVTSAASPNKCRQRQVRYAALWVVFWLAVVLVSAHLQDVFQREHIFRGQDFPADAWKAWWSWFGL